ncbi:MAG TPA: hypothetical protein PLQ36_02955, partial [Candidatus Gracilibacteria bacterium]|nr:hypothetical protein [Candidatus Gracilibacteria bacterium]
ESDGHLNGVYLYAPTNNANFSKIIVDYDYQDEDLNQDGIIAVEEQGAPPGTLYDLRQAQGWN